MIHHHDSLAQVPVLMWYSLNITLYDSLTVNVVLSFDLGRFLLVSNCVAVNIKF